MVVAAAAAAAAAAAVDLASPIARDRSYDEILVTEKLNAAAVLARFFILSRRHQSRVSVGSTVFT